MKRFASILSAAVLFLSVSARAGDTYKVDPVHSAILFRIGHANIGYVHGRFNDFGGSVTLDESDPTKDAFNFEVKADSVDTHNDKRDGHLKSPDFLNAKQYPTISFKSTSVKKVADNKLEVTGDLTLHGVTKPVTVPLELIGKGEFPKGTPRVGMEATFEIKQSDFEIKGVPGATSDALRLTVAIEATK